MAERTEQILIVEDEGLIAADVQNKLQRFGYPAPAVVQTGAEALARARSTPFDLVLMDIRLKGEIDGIATAQALRAESETPVIYMTAHADQETIDRAQVTEPLGYVLKPISDAGLRSAVQISLYRHRMERRVRASEAWLSATLRNVGDGLIATDAAGEIVFMNPAAEKLTGWLNADARGCLLMAVLSLVEESSGQPAWNPVFDLRPGESRCYRLLPKDGPAAEVEIQCFENRLAETAGPDAQFGAIVVLRDIAARRKLEGRLLQAQRMQAIANLAGGIAHDFNNRLMVILGYAEELCESMEGEEKNAAEEIKNAALRAADTARQLLMLSGRGEARPEVLGVNEVICEVQPAISRGLGEHRTLVTDLGSPPASVRFDRNLLKHVLFNLALNARDAMSPGGEMRIESSTVEIRPDSQEARFYRPRQYVRVRVSDTGMGVDRTALARIFEPSFENSHVGPALGLSIAHTVIAQGGGYIGVESETGRGTTFEILLPCVGAFRRVSQAGKDLPPTVLLVEDDDAIRHMMHNYLEGAGYQLLEAGSAAEGEEIAELYPTAIHALVTAAYLPGTTGPELARRLTALRPDMKALFLTEYTEVSPKQPGHPHGGLHLLTKPFSPDELLERLRVLLGQGPQPAS